MAGVVPSKRPTGRKQWTVHEGPRSSLKRLRNQLASDGCPESQVVLAKQLLDENNTESNGDSIENARLGVYWLIKASQQGNLEATYLLKTCLETGRGITEHNYMDVKSCITMTQDEKLARKAAREMFASLSNGGDFITSYQLQRKILAIDRDRSEKSSENKHIYENGDALQAELVNDFEETSDSDEDTDWSLRSDSSNEKLTEDHLVSAAVNYSHGHLPIVNRILCLSDPNLKALDHIPVMHRSLLHPLLALKILYYKFIKFIGKQRLSSFFPVAKTEVQLLGLLLVYSLYSSENVAYFFPTLLYYVSLLVMFITTCQMLQRKLDYLDFRLWSGLFICYSGGSINSEQAEYQYIRNNLKPYGHFFLALLLNLITYPIIVEQWIPQSELTIITFCLTFMTLFGFMPRKRSKMVISFLVLLSFGVNVLAKYPYETDPVVTQGWRFLDLKVPTFYTYVIGNGIEFCLNFRVLLYACIPVIFVKLASQNNWKGTYDSLIPHCVTLSWLQVCIISSQGATMFGLLRGTLALVGFVLFLPLVGFTSILLPVLALTKWLVSSYTVVSVCLFIILMCMCLALAWLLAQSHLKHYTALLQALIGIIGFLVLINSSIPYDDLRTVKVTKYLSWDVYQRFCHQPIWEEENVAISQMKCAELNNVPIRWDGYVNDIKIKSISNSWRYFFDKFPEIIRKYLYCLYGEETESSCGKMPDLIKSDCLAFYDAIKSVNECSLEKYNLYTFEITMRMASGVWGKSPEVIVVANDNFKNFSLHMKPSDYVWFKGKVFNYDTVGSDGILGGTKPHVVLEQIGCITCHYNKLTEFKYEKINTLDVRNIFRYLYICTKFIVTLLLNPILILK